MAQLTGVCKAPLPSSGDLLGVTHEPTLCTVIPGDIVREGEGGGEAERRKEGSATALASKLKRRRYSLPGRLTGGSLRGGIDPEGDVAPRKNFRPQPRGGVRTAISRPNANFG